MAKVCKQAIYRKTSHCANCPFLDNGKKIHLVDGRVADIKDGLLEGGSFNCHKTVYNLDEKMMPTEEQSLKMCYGAYLFLKENGVQNQVMQVAERLLGED